MINWLIGCNCKGSFSIPKISIASLCSKTFSGLGCSSRTNSPVLWTKFSGLCFSSSTISPVLWTKFSGLGIARMINWLIGCNCNSSFSIPKISIASLCSKIFSGLNWVSKTNSPVFWTKFSGLGVFSMVNSPALWTKLSGLGIAAMYNWFIGCNCNSSFSIPKISIASFCSKTFSGLCSCSMTISPALWTSFSGFVNPKIINWFIGWITGSSFSAPWICTASLDSKIFSGLCSFSITISPALWTSFSGLSNPSTIKALINCLWIGAFSIPTISTLSLCSRIFSGLSCFFISTNSFIVSRFSHGCFSPLMNIKLIRWIVGSSFSIPATSIVVPCSTMFSSFPLETISNPSMSLTLISSNHFSNTGVPFICKRFMFCFDNGSFSNPAMKTPSLPSSWTRSSQFLPNEIMERSSWDISLSSFQSRLSFSMYKVFMGQFWTNWFHFCLSEMMLRLYESKSRKFLRSSMTLNWFINWLSSSSFSLMWVSNSVILDSYSEVILLISSMFFWP